MWSPAIPFTAGRSIRARTAVILLAAVIAESMALAPVPTAMAPARVAASGRSN